MTDNLPARQPERSKQIRGRLKHAIELMIWNGLARDEAAQQAGMQPHSLYCAFRKAHVKGHYLRELEVLRTSERAKNVHALVSVRDNSENAMAQVAAVKALELLSEESTARTSSVPVSPGLVIQIVAPSPTDRAQDRLVDVTPPPAPRQTIEHEPTPADNPDFISIEEIQGKPLPPDESHHTPIEGYELERRLPDADDRPEPPRETLDQFKERLLAGVPRLAPASMQAAPPIRGEPNFREPEPRLSPMRRRWRDIRSGN
jgi:hypothetical protein